MKNLLLFCPCRYSREQRQSLEPAFGFFLTVLAFAAFASAPLLARMTLAAGFSGSLLATTCFAGFG